MTLPPPSSAPFDSPRFDANAFDQWIEHHLKLRMEVWGKPSLPGLNHPLIDQFVKYLAVDYAKLAMLLQDRLVSTDVAEPAAWWHRTGQALVAYGAATAREGATNGPATFPPPHGARRVPSLLRRALCFRNEHIKPYCVSYIQNGALMALYVLAINGDWHATHILRNPDPGFLADHGSVAQLRRHLLKGLPMNGDNAMSNTEACDELNRLLNEASTEPRTSNQKPKPRPELYLFGLGAIPATHENVAVGGHGQGRFRGPGTQGDDSSKPGEHRVAMNIPVSQAPAAMRNVFGIHPRLGHAFLEVLKVKDTWFVPANNLKRVEYDGKGVVVEGPDYRFVLRQSYPENVRLNGWVTTFPDLD